MIQMFKPVRVVATIIFLGSIVLVFIGAFVINSDVRRRLCLTLLPSLLTSSTSAVTMHQCVLATIHLRACYADFLCYSPRYRRIPRLHVVHAFVHSVRAHGGTQGIRHVMPNAAYEPGVLYSKCRCCVTVYVGHF